MSGPPPKSPLFPYPPSSDLRPVQPADGVRPRHAVSRPEEIGDRKSTRLNSSHSQISYAVFCLKKRTGHERTLGRPPRARQDGGVVARAPRHVLYASVIWFTLACPQFQLWPLLFFF